MKARVLVVDDDAPMCAFLEKGLSKCGFEVVSENSFDAALTAIGGSDFEVIVTDVQMPKTTGIELCRRLSERRPDVPVIVMTAFGSMESAVSAIRAGAYDYIAKPFEIEGLSLALERAVRHRSLTEEVKRLRSDASRDRPGRIVGESATIRDVFETISKLETVDSTVLIHGETGTGKELVARALHERSARRSMPFIAVNCASIPDALLESELFGYVKGAFTDAKTDKKGLFREAHGGTLFLDEVGDLPSAFQPKLLRVLQDQKIRPIGGREEVECDIRLIAATHRDLDTDVDEGRFREDLYFRLNVIPIELPPLRERGTDVLLIAQHFIDQFRIKAKKNVSGLTTPAAEKLLAYSWPGNVRELSNCIERAVALTEHEQLLVDDLPARIQDYQDSHVVVIAGDSSELVSLAEVEDRYIDRVLKEVGNNKTLAARILGIERKTLYRKLEKRRTHRRGNGARRANPTKRT